jgi:hypothetical protein
MHIKRALAVLTIFAASCTAQASAYYYNAANEHYYEFVDFGDVVGLTQSWNSASAYAATLSLTSASGYEGHLATLSSQAEDDFVWSFLNANGVDALASGRFLGAYKDANAAWQWVTGESFNYANWMAGEPNNSGGNENYLMNWWSADALGGRWNDTTETSCIAGQCSTWGFVVEFEPTVVPVPSALLLFASGLALVGYRKNKR